MHFSSQVLTFKCRGHNQMIPGILSTLKRLILVPMILFTFSNFSFAEEFTDASLNNEFFDVGISTGILNIEDFNSELVTGINATFNANEDYFIQFNYINRQNDLHHFVADRLCKHLYCSEHPHC